MVSLRFQVLNLRNMQDGTRRASILFVKRASVYMVSVLVMVAYNVYDGLE